VNATPLPMLAVAGEPFDSPDYLFEVKWDGVRALATREAERWRLWGRDQADYQSRYPELEVLRRLPSGTTVDGELLCFHQGLPDLSGQLARHGLTNGERIRAAAHVNPVTYVMFDLLEYQGRSLTNEPLERRREALQELLALLQEPRLVFSEGVIGAGVKFFEAAVQQGQEGVMAKHRASRYLAGRRSAAWRKIKPHPNLAAVAIGFRGGRSGVRRLLVAAPWQGRLQYVATLSNGFKDAERRLLQSRLERQIRSRPVVPCPQRAIWVEPELYCQVRYLSWTPAGHLRGACFRGALDESGVSRASIG
jgi:ATP-dependent DNA ligase